MWLTNDTLFPTVPKAEKSKIMALVVSVFAEDPLSGSLTAILSFCPHLVTEGAPWDHFCKVTNPIHEGFTLTT